MGDCGSLRQKLTPYVTVLAKLLEIKSQQEI
jgi:hypothetical protein